MMKTQLNTFSSIGSGCKIAPDWKMGAIERLGSHSRKFAPLNFSGNCHEQMLIMFAKDIKVDSGFLCKCYPLQMLRLSRLLRLCGQTVCTLNH